MFHMHESERQCSPSPTPPCETGLILAFLQQKWGTAAGTQSHQSTKFWLCFLHITVKKITVPYTVKARSPLRVLWVLQRKHLLSSWTEMYLLCWDYMSKKNTYSPNSELLIKSLPSKVLRRQTVLKARASRIMPATETCYCLLRKGKYHRFQELKSFQKH